MLPEFRTHAHKRLVRSIRVAGNRLIALLNHQRLFQGIAPLKHKVTRYFQPSKYNRHITGWDVDGDFFINVMLNQALLGDQRNH